MAVFLEKKPHLIRNAIVEQVKQAANSLTIQEWNQVVNTLKLQTNVTVEYLEKLHRALFGTFSSTTTGFNEFEDIGVIYTLLNLLQNAQELGTLKTNFYGKADETITKGDFIMFGGAQGDHILFKKADLASQGFIPEYIMGVAESSMVQGDFGYVRWFGQVTGLLLKDANNNNLADGTLLWVGSPAGKYAYVEPTVGPRILMAVVEKASTGNNNSNGIILVRPTLGTSHELNIVNATDGQFLRYDNASQHFKNITANKVVTSDTAPSENKTGDIWFNT